MSDIPERIWAHEPTTFDECDVWTAYETGNSTEYVPVDILEASQKRVAELEAKIKAAIDACDCADDLVAQQEPISAASVTIWVRRALKAQTGR